MRIAALMSCFNRKIYTLRCLKQLINDIPAGIGFDVYLLNDGCTDGTPEEVKTHFPSVNIINGDGSYYWNRGMNKAFEEAYKSKYDFYMWVNDDVMFYKDIVKKLVESYNSVKRKNIKSIIVGYTMDQTEKEVTYSAFREKKTIIPLTFERVIPSTQLEEADSFHGNCVLIPAAVVEQIGFNDNTYRHGFGDADYGLTAVRNGCKVYLTNYPVGICDRNDANWAINRDKMPLKERYRRLNSVKQRPVKEWLYFTKKFGGSRWWMRFICPYIKVFVSHVRIMVEH